MLDGGSLDIAAEKRRELLRLFPEARTEGGKIDFDRLKLSLGIMVDAGKERYGLTWPGKAECFRTIQAPSMATLLPRPEKSVDFDMAKNVIIEGDNLEILKLLQKPYLGKVKMIYIDPPYNTGNDFIYPDDYSESLQTYLQYTRQVDADGKRFSTNADTDGRFHSKWLSMMHPRLYLARNLLRADGSIFVSIDSGEQHRLRALMDEIFGEANFLGLITWQGMDTIKNDAKYFSTNSEYILVYAKSIDDVRLRGIRKTEKQRAYYKNYDEDKNGPYLLTPLHAKSGTESGAYSYTFGNGQEWRAPVGTYPRYSQDRLRQLEAEGRIYLDPLGVKIPQRKTYLSEVSDRMRPWTFWRYEDFGSTRQANAELEGILGRGVFQNPKPSKLIKKLIDLISDGDDLILDLFAGSGTTGQAVLDLNSEDGGSRQFILVQLPEATGRQDYATIADICEERVRRVISSLDERDGGQQTLVPSPRSAGFRVFSLADSNIKEWDSTIAHDPETLRRQLELGVDHLRPDRSDLDIVYEVLLKSGYPLSSKIIGEPIEGKHVYSIADGAFLVCLDRHLTLDLMRAIAARKPERVLMLDEGFAGNDQLKTNAAQVFAGKNITFRTL